MDIEQLTELFKWMTIINVSLYFLSALLVITLKNAICNMHSKLFGVAKEDIPGHVYAYMARYKIFVIVFNIVPYVALCFVD